MNLITNLIKEIPFARKGMRRNVFALTIVIGIFMLGYLLMMENNESFFISLLRAIAGWLLMGNGIGVVVFTSLFVSNILDGSTVMFFEYTISIMILSSYLLICMCRCRIIGVSRWWCLVPLYNPIKLLLWESEEDYHSKDGDLLIIIGAIAIYLIAFICLLWSLGTEKHEGDNCPMCESTNVGTFEYGLWDFYHEDSIFTKKVREGIIISGGCVIDGDSPKYRCNDCGYTWGRIIPRY